LCSAAPPPAGGDPAVAPAAPDLRSRQVRGGGGRRARCLCHRGRARQCARERVVSMPSWDIFEHQPQAYRESVLPPGITARIAVEQGSVLGWDRYVGAAGRVIGMKTFGASAPLKELQRKFGFEPERIVSAAKEVLGHSLKCQNLGQRR